jgi:hypothetical protein
MRAHCFERIFFSIRVHTIIEHNETYCVSTTNSMLRIICISNPVEGVTPFHKPLHLWRLHFIAIALTDDANCILVHLEFIISHCSNGIGTFN